MTTSLASAPCTDLSQLAPVQEFSNVTIYFRSEFLGISQIACKSVKVEVLPYAQYANALKVTFVPVGKRKARYVWIYYRPFLMVVPTANAITVDNFNAPDTSTPGITVRSGKYGSCDSRYVTDVVDAMAAAGIEPILNVCYGQ